MQTVFVVYSSLGHVLSTQLFAYALLPPGQYCCDYFRSFVIVVVQQTKSTIVNDD